MENGRATENPVAAVVRPKLPRRFPRPAPTEDIVDAIEHAPVRMRLWICLAAYGGLRCMEIAGLRVDDIRLDVNPPILHLRETKGNRDRVVPIAEEIKKAMVAYGLPMGGLVFPALAPTGKPLRPLRALPANYVSYAINTYLHDRGIGATAHQLRHWFGTEMYRRTHDLKLVGELMGHAKLETTSLYVALIPTEASVEAVRTLKALPVDGATKGELHSTTDQGAPASLAQPYRLGPDGEWITDQVVGMTDVSTGVDDSAGACGEVAS